MTPDPRVTRINNSGMVVIETTLEVVTSITATTGEVAHLGVREDQEGRGMKAITTIINTPISRSKLPQ